MQVCTKKFYFRLVVKFVLRRLLLLLAVFSILALPAASADDGGNGTGIPVEGELHFTSYPQVYINATANTSFNLSYEGMLLFTQYGFYYTYFPSETWTVHRVSNNSLYYASHLTFHKSNVNYLMGLESKFNINSTLIQGNQEDSGSGHDSSISSDITVWMNKTMVSNPVPGNNASLSGFQLTFTMTSNSISGSGDLLLIQQLGAKLGNGYEQYHHLANLSQNLTSLNSTVIGVTSTSYDAYYWWNSTFSINGNTAQLNASKSTDGNVDTLIFQYHFTNGINYLSQDPYFSVPQVNLFQSPILQKDIQNAASFILVHSELLAAGFASGFALLGIAYGSFRRRRF